MLPTQQFRFYASHMESDPVKIAVEGVEAFKENCDLIVADSSGRQCHVTSRKLLFSYRCQVAEATKPDLVLFVMDGSIGQAAFDQAEAFKQGAEVGAAVVTKMDGHAKGGGALSAAAATISPVMFIGTGEHMDKFEVFDVKPFFKHLLGMSDWPGLLNKIPEVAPKLENQPQQSQKGPLS